MAFMSFVMPRSVDAALPLDRLLDEPHRLHSLVGIDRLANAAAISSFITLYNDLADELSDFLAAALKLWT
jgi:hypothetical protein